ncbi:MAG: beta-propeller fold lactonase family protein [Rhodopila sp.]|nr:beta-propeller fold lactonase family protein [Rhodopila sp.]
MRPPLAIATLGTFLTLSYLSPAAQAATMVYVANADSREIGVLTLDESNGHLHPIERVKVTGAVFPLAFSPDHRFLYAGLRSEPYSVTTFAVNQTNGALTSLSTVPLPDNMAYISTDRTGRFLFGASYFGDKVSVNPIGQQGFVQPRPVQVIPTRPKAHAILVDPSNSWVFATNLGGDIILQYKFDAVTGMLTPNTPPFIETAKGKGPRFFVFHPGGRFVYATDELGNAVDTYSFNAANGTLALASSAKVAPDDVKGTPAPADLHITPDGRFLYASERTSNTLAGYKVDVETGALTLIGHTPTEAKPRGFAIDPRGHYLLAVGEVSNAMTSYAINQETGALAPVFHLPMGKDPNWVEIVDIP